MRRKDRECNTPAFFEEVLGKAEHLALAMNNAGYPYCLPFNFCRLGNRIYIHVARDGGQKLACIKADERVAFSVAVDVAIDQPKFTTYYKSVCGTGNAAVVEDREEKRLALESLGARYKANCPRPCPDSVLDRVDVIRVDIVEMTGKQHLPTKS